MDELNSNFTGTIRLTGSIAATTCLGVITLLFLLLIFYKVYTSVLQRLLLYLTIVTVIPEACMTVGYTTQFEYSGHKMFCDTMSIFWQWSTTVGYLLTLAMIVFLPYKIYERFKRDPFPRLSRSKCLRVAMECSFIFIVLVLPLAFILPFVHCGYYLSQPQLCNRSIMDQITNPEAKNCIGQLTIQILVSSLVPSIVSFIDFVGIFVDIIALSVVFCCLAREYRETRKTLRRTLILLVLFAAYIVISLVFSGVFTGVVLPSIMTNKPDILTKLRFYLEVLSVVNPVILSVSQLIFPLTFLFYLYSFNLFRWTAIKRAAAEWRCFRSCCGRENIPRVDQIQEAATVPSSHCVSAPSDTFFDMPYSRVTTDVCNEEEQPLLPDGGGGRGHGTIRNL